MSFREILELFRQGKTTAKSHIKNLIEIAVADGKFTDDENALLISIAARNGITKKKIQEIRAKSSSIVFEVPKDEKDKFNQMYDLVHMMVVDKSIHSEELRLCEIFASKFGYKKERIKGMIETVKLNIENGNGPDETYERFVYYLKFNQLAKS
jgi:uncharacterized tellurite resistance protein B-like protein